MCSNSANIAEGHSRGHKQEFVQFLRIAFASGAELETQLIIARKIGYLEKSTYELLIGQLTEIMKMTNSLISKLV